MKLRIFLPDTERPEASAHLPWMLFDSRGSLLREGDSPPADIPHAEAVEAVLPSTRVLFARLKLPRVNASTIRELLPFAVEDRLLADPAHIHAVAGPTDARGETVVAVIDREWFHGMLAALAGSGIHPTRAWCESAILAGGHGDWNLVLGTTRGMLVDDEGISTTFDSGSFTTLPLAIRIALDEASQRGERPTSVRVHTEGATPLPDLAPWSAESGVKFSPGGQWEALARDEPPPNAINLLTDEFATRPSGLARLRVPRAAIALVAVIALLQIALVGIDAWRLERERAVLEARREAIFRDAFPEAKVVVDPELQMSRNLAELRRTRGLASDDDFLSALTRAARESPAKPKSLQFTNGRLEVAR
jgi:general secretion pathway protein L